MSVSISRDEWLKALADIGQDERTDEDAITVSEFAEMMGIKRTAAGDRLRMLVQAGRAIEKRKAVFDSRGRRCVHLAYRLIDAKQPKRKQ